VNATPLRILFLCTANSARSQLAEALLAARRDPRVVGMSAGTRPGGRVHPMAIETLRERGVDTGGLRPKTIAEAVEGMPDVVITVCDAARDECPVLPGAPLQVHWGLPDPAAVTGEEACRSAFAGTADVLDERLTRMLELRLESLEGEALGSALGRLAD